MDPVRAAYAKIVWVRATGILGMTRFLLTTAILLGALPVLAAENRSDEADKARCSAFGYQAGTQSFADCMLKLYSQRQEVKLAWCKAEGERLALLGDKGESMSRLAFKMACGGN